MGNKFGTVRRTRSGSHANSKSDGSLVNNAGCVGKTCLSGRGAAGRLDDPVSADEDVALFHPRKRRPSDVSMQTLLQEPVISSAFRDFMLTKFSEDFTMLWADLYSYEMIPYESSVKSARAQEIYSKYFDIHSTIPLVKSGHIDAQTVANLRRNLLVDDAGVVKQSDPYVLAESFKFIYAKVITILKFEFMPQFLVSDKFGNLDSLALAASPKHGSGRGRNLISRTGSHSTQDEACSTAENENSDAPEPGDKGRARDHPKLEDDGDESGLQDLSMHDSLASPCELSGEKLVFAAEMLDFGNVDIDNLNAEMLLTHPCLSTYFLDFVHSQAISDEVSRLVAGDGRNQAVRPMGLEPGANRGSARLKNALLRRGSLRKRNGSVNNNISESLHSTLLLEKRRQLDAKSGRQPSANSMASHASGSPGDEETGSFSSGGSSSRSDEEWGFVLMKINTLRSAADLVELFCEVEDFRASESDPKHQFERLQRIFTQYGQTPGFGSSWRHPIQPPIEFLQRHFSRFEKKVGRYRDIVYTQKDSTFFDTVRREVIERLDMHVVPLFLESSSFNHMLKCSLASPRSQKSGVLPTCETERLSNALDHRLEVTHEKIKLLAQFAEDRRLFSRLTYKFTLESALSLPWGAFYLKRFARKRLQEESVLFVLEIDAFRKMRAMSPDRDPAALAARCRRICELYVLDSSPMQVNISYQQRSAVIQSIYVELNYSPDVFEEVRAEVLRVLKLNLWPAFKHDSMHDNLQRKCTHNAHRSVRDPGTRALSEDDPLLRPMMPKNRYNGKSDSSIALDAAEPGLSLEGETLPSMALQSVSRQGSSPDLSSEGVPSELFVGAPRGIGLEPQSTQQDVSRPTLVGLCMAAEHEAAEIATEKVLAAAASPPSAQGSHEKQRAKLEPAVSPIDDSMSDDVVE